MRSMVEGLAAGGGARGSPPLHHQPAAGGPPPRAGEDIIYPVAFGVSASAPHSDQLPS